MDRLNRFPPEVLLLKFTTRLLTTLGGIVGGTLGAAAATHLGVQWFRTRKVDPELRHRGLLVHPIWRTPALWNRSYPGYAATHLEPRTSHGDVSGVRISSHNVAGYAGGPPVSVRHYTAAAPTTKPATTETTKLRLGRHQKRADAQPTTWQNCRRRLDNQPATGQEPAADAGQDIVAQGAGGHHHDHDRDDVEQAPHS